MTVPDEAIEAAAKAYYSKLGMSPWEHLGPLTQNGYRRTARAALEAAAPYLRAGALEDAADEMEASRPEMGPGINITQYREGRHDAFTWAAHALRARAATERGGE